MRLAEETNNQPNLGTGGERFDWCGIASSPFDCLKAQAGH